ncbi:hypothetical protein WN944_007252 [Citrus x changshan-huyou]|uniref:Amine oxidase domain-containing protein n=1 Tax=Citrus x changshan-huyou TaxID=2935761 RepID=A0AAP0QQ96_9ROSI
MPSIVMITGYSLLLVSADKNLLMKDHTRTLVNKGGEIGVQTYDKARNALALALSPVVKALVDSISFSDWFLSKGGTRTSIQRMWDPVAYALGFIDCDNISACCMLTIFALFATKTEASLLRMLKGSPDVYLSGPIRKHITDKGGRFHLRWGCREILYDKSANGETYVKGVAMSKATDKKVVQADAYVADADFSCFADLALTSPEDYYREGQGSLLQCVLMPGDPYMPLPNDEIIRRVAKQVLALFPSSQGLEVIWSSFVKIGQSLCGEGPGKDPFRRDQKTPVKNFFLAGSYTKQIVWKEQLCLVDKPQATHALPGKN